MSDSDGRTWDRIIASMIVALSVGAGAMSVNRSVGINTVQVETFSGQLELLRQHLKEVESRADQSWVKASINSEWIDMIRERIRETLPPSNGSPVRYDDAYRDAVQMYYNVLSSREYAARRQ